MHKSYLQHTEKETTQKSPVFNKYVMFDPSFYSFFYNLFLELLSKDPLNIGGGHGQREEVKDELREL